MVSVYYRDIRQLLVRVDKSCVAAAVSTAKGIRAALASYATDSAQISLESITYESADGSHYTLTIKTTVPDIFTGRSLIVTPQRIVIQ